MILATISPQSVANPYPPSEVASSNGKKPHGLFPSLQIKESQNTHFRLGFAGRIQTHCIGSCGDAELDSTSGRRPLFWEVNHPWFPSVYIAADYDFSACRYCVTHCSTTVKCRIEPWKTMIRSNLVPIAHLNGLSTLASNLWLGAQRSFPRILPATVEMTREHALLEPNVAFVWVYRWPWRCRTSSNPVHSEMDELTIQHRTCRKSVTTTLTIPLHSRLRLKCRLRNKQVEAKEPVEQNSSSQEEDWWIPDVCVDALGLMESKNRLWLQNRKIGFTLSVRRRLNWSAVGLPSYDDFDAEPTRIQFQVQHRSPTKSSMVEISTFLDQPLTSASVLLQQDFLTRSI
jgi:hypothetical protein